MMSHNLKIQPVILLGGMSTRLYPVCSNKSGVPKPFIKIGDKGTLIEQTINRVALVMKDCTKKGYTTYNPLLIMNRDHKLPEELSLHEENVLYEHHSNDTAVAVARASLEVKKRHLDDNVIMLVLPADHYIENIEAFVYDIVEGILKVTDDNIVLYGIEPTSVDTKYGYIVPNLNGVNFIEKPDYHTALELIKSQAMWNSGIFVAKVDHVLECLRFSRYNILDWIVNPRPEKAVSFDVAVLQAHSYIYPHRSLSWKFSDVGTWISFTALKEVQDEMENDSTVILKNCKNVNVLNRNFGNVVVIGLENLLVITSGNDLLIMPNGGGESYDNVLKQVATELNSK